MKKLLATVIAVAATASLWSCQADGEWLKRRQVAAERGEQHRAEQSFRQWKRNWARSMRDLQNTTKQETAWGKEKRPVRSRMVVLDPPLVKTVGPDRIQVEWFWSPIDERGMSVVFHVNP